MSYATYDGADVFGPWVSIDHSPKPTAAQLAAFFGVSGAFSQWGGTRGRAFLVKGTCLAYDLPGLRAYENSWHAYNDGIARTLVDTLGYSWPNVLFKGEFMFVGPFAWTHDGQVVRNYKAVMEGLT